MRIFSFLCLFFISFYGKSQVRLSVKTNLLFPTNSTTWESFSTTAQNSYEAKGRNNVGYNVGIAAKINVMKHVFLMPEIYYTTFKNKHTDIITNTTLEAVNNRADLPVLLGYDILEEHFSVFAGPVGSYYLATNNQYNDFRENAKNKFTVGYQIGAQIKISNLIFSGRYEGPFTTNQREYINNNTNQTIRYDNRSSLFLAGLGYEF